MSNNEIEACQKKYKELEAGKSGIYNTIGRLYFEKYKDSPAVSYTHLTLPTNSRV